MPWWSLNIESILQGGWLLLLQGMRSGRANSASHSNVIFLRHSCSLPSWKYIILHLSASFPKGEWKMIFFILFIWGKCNCYFTSGKYYSLLLCSLVLTIQSRQLGDILATGAEFLLDSQKQGARSSCLLRERKKIPPIWEAETLVYRRGCFSLWWQAEAPGSPLTP